MKTINYSRIALSYFIIVCFGLMTIAAGFIKIFEIEPETKWYYLFYLIGLISPSLAGTVYIWKATKSLGYFKHIWYNIRKTNGWKNIFLLPLSLMLTFIGMTFFGLPFEMDQLHSSSSLFIGFLGWSTIIWMEELGWRGILLPVLQNKFSPLFATTIINLIWVLWHLPLLLLIDMSLEQILLFSLQTFGIACVLTWTFNQSQNVLTATLIHAAYNATSGWLLTGVPSIQANEMIGVLALGPLVLGLIIIIYTRGKLGLKPLLKEKIEISSAI